MRGGMAGSAIAEQVIPELDEQATVISMRKPEPRPHMQDIFAVAVPTTPSPTVELSSQPRFVKSSPLSVPVAGAGGLRPRRQASSESSGSEDERATLRSSPPDVEAGTTASDTQSLLLNQPVSPPKLVRQAASDEAV